MLKKSKRKIGKSNQLTNKINWTTKLTKISDNKWKELFSKWKIVASKLIINGKIFN